MTELELKLSNDLTAEFVNYSGLTVYGTYDEPLFPVNQILRLLKITKIHMNRNGFKIGEEYVKEYGIARNGANVLQYMFTEHGLYRMIYKSRTEAGENFRKFVTKLLKEIRLSGSLELRRIIEQIAEDSKSNKIGEHLYIISDGEGWYKIGRSSKADRRVKEVQTGNPYELTILKTFEGKGCHESTIHLKASIVTKAYRSEWFQLTQPDLDNLIQWIETIT